MAAKKSVLSEISRYLEALAKNARANKVISGAVISALLGGVLKLTEVTKTFPEPADLIGNIIIFAAILFIAVDICKGGLFD